METPENIGNIDASLTLESQVFRNTIEKNLFIEWLSKHDHINPIFESRGVFNTRKGNILIKTPWIGQDGKRLSKLGAYTLYMPNDMQIDELPTIIRRINHITFGEKLPDYASTQEMQFKIVLLIDTLLQRLSSIGLSRQEIDSIKKAISKYTLLYGDFTNPEEARKISNVEYRNKFIQSANGQEKYKAIQEKIIHIRTVEKLSDLQHEIESLTSMELIKHLNESIFERGIETIRQGLETVTQAEQESIRRKAISDGFISSPNNPSLLTKGDEMIQIHTEDQDLRRESIYLRDAMQIDKYKTQLAAVRKKGNKIEIERIEMEATNVIAGELFKYPYRLLGSNKGYTPRGVIDNKEIYCIGFSLIGHAMLSELGIKHQGLDIPEHSALSVDIGGNQYVLDGTWDGTIEKYTFTLPNPGEGEYGKINSSDDSYNSLAIRGDPERILQGQMYNNLGNIFLNQQKYSEAIIFYQKSIELNPKNANTYINIGNISFLQQKYSEAIIFYQKSIELNPKDINAYSSLGNALYFQGKYPEALLAYNKVIELSPENIDIYTNMGATLLNLEKYPEALLIFEKAIELNPRDIITYNNLGQTFLHLEKYSEALTAFKKVIELNPMEISTYNDLGNVLDKYMGNSSLGDLLRYISLVSPLINQENYNLEKEEIKKFLSNKDYNGLRIYIIRIVDMETSQKKSKN